MSRARWFARGLVLFFAVLLLAPLCVLSSEVPSFADVPTAGWSVCTSGGDPVSWSELDFTLAPGDSFSLPSVGRDLEAWVDVDGGSWMYPSDYGAATGNTTPESGVIIGPYLNETGSAVDVELSDYGPFGAGGSDVYSDHASCVADASQGTVAVSYTASGGSATTFGPAGGGSPGGGAGGSGAADSATIALVANSTSTLKDTLVSLAETWLLPIAAVLVALFVGWRKLRQFVRG